MSDRWSCGPEQPQPNQRIAPQHWSRSPQGWSPAKCRLSVSPQVRVLCCLAPLWLGLAVVPGLTIISPSNASDLPGQNQAGPDQTGPDQTGQVQSGQYQSGQGQVGGQRTLRSGAGHTMKDPEVVGGGSASDHPAGPSLVIRMSDQGSSGDEASQKQPPTRFPPEPGLDSPIRRIPTPAEAGYRRLPFPGNDQYKTGTKGQETGTFGGFSVSAEPPGGRTPPKMQPASGWPGPAAHRASVAQPHKLPPNIPRTLPTAGLDAGIQNPIVQTSAQASPVLPGEATPVRGLQPPNATANPAEAAPQTSNEVSRRVDPPNQQSAPPAEEKPTASTAAQPGLEPGIPPSGLPERLDQPERLGQPERLDQPGQPDPGASEEGEERMLPQVPMLDPSKLGPGVPLTEMLSPPGTSPGSVTGLPPSKAGQAQGQQDDYNDPFVVLRTLTNPLASQIFFMDRFREPFERPGPSLPDRFRFNSLAEYLNEKGVAKFTAAGFFGETPGNDSSYLTFEGMLGLYTRGRESLWWIEARGVAQNYQEPIMNFGLGNRQFSDLTGGIVGLNFWYDYRGTDLNTFHQFGIGVELFGDVFEARGNLYLPMGETEARAGTSPRAVLLPGNNNVFRADFFEEALAGIEGEVGMRARLTPNTESRVAIGAYFFEESDDQDFNDRGFLIRFETHLAANTNVSLEVRTDAQDDTTVLFGVLFSWPSLNGLQNSLKSRDLLTRLGERVRRLQTIAVARFVEINPVVVNNEQVELFFVDNFGGGTGESPNSPVNPAELQNPFIVPTFGDGDIVVLLDQTGDILGDLTLDSPFQRVVGSQDGTGEIQIPTIDGIQVVLDTPTLFNTFGVLNLGGRPTLNGQLTLSAPNVLADGFDIVNAGAAPLLVDGAGAAAGNFDPGVPASVIVTDLEITRADAGDIVVAQSDAPVELDMLFARNTLNGTNVGGNQTGFDVDIAGGNFFAGDSVINFQSVVGTLGFEIFNTVDSPVLLLDGRTNAVIGAGDLFDVSPAGSGPIRGTLEINGGMSFP